MEAPRPLNRRIADTIRHLEEDTDAWVATVDENGNPRITPLSFLWFIERIIVTTPQESPTGRNLVRNKQVRLAFGATRDVVMMDGTVTCYRAGAVPSEIGDTFAEKLWDARREREPFGFYEIRPQRIQAWREVNEIPGRTLMRGGSWLSQPAGWPADERS
jgi:hypothetical protein